MRRRSTDEELRRVYREHLQAVFAFFAYAVPRDIAEDLTATTFERVVRNWKRYDASRASERTWIIAIARNALVDHHRRMHHRRTLSIDADPLFADTVAESVDRFDEHLSRDGFAWWLRELSEREQQVLAARFAADLSAAEIARLLDLSEANVHQIVSRALKKLRAKASQLDPT